MQETSIGQYAHLSDTEFGKKMRQAMGIHKNIGRDIVEVAAIPGQKLISVPDEPESEKPFRDYWGNYSPVSKMKTMYSRDSSKNDIFDLLGQVSNASFQLFVEMKLKLNPSNNLVHYPLDSMTVSQVSSFNQKAKQLINIGIFKRARTIDEKHPVKKHTFMVNPYLIIPKKNTGDIRQEWDLLH